MTALTQDRKTPFKEGLHAVYPVKQSTQLFLGSLVCLDATGYAVKGADTAGLLFVGVAAEQADNSGGGDGDITVKVKVSGVHELEASGLLITDVGADLFIADDQTLAKSTGNSIKAGRLMRYDSATKAACKLMPVTGAVD